MSEPSAMHQQIADMQAAMRALWPDRPKVYFVPGQGDDAPVLTEEEQGQLRRVALAIADARTPVDTGRTFIEYAAAERDFEDGASPSPTRELAEVEVLQNNRAGLRSHLAKREVWYGPWTEVKEL